MEFRTREGRLKRWVQVTGIIASVLAAIGTVTGGVLTYDSSVDERIARGVQEAQEEVRIVEQKTGEILDQRYCTDLGDKIRFLENKQEFDELADWEKSELRRLRNMYERRCSG